MASAIRTVPVDFWTNEKLISRFTAEEKLFILYLMTNPYSTQLGIYRLPMKASSVQLGISDESFKILLKRFEAYGMIKFSEVTNEVAIKGYLKNSIIKGGKPMLNLLLKEEKRVRDKRLVQYIFDDFNNFNGDVNKTVQEFIETVHKRGFEEKKESTNVDIVVEMHNEICKSFPKITRLSKKRKELINARLKTYSLDDMKRLFEKAESSNFLRGENKYNWKGYFDWFITDTHMAKILDGVYDNVTIGNEEKARYDAKQIYGELLSEVHEHGMDNGIKF